MPYRVKPDAPLVCVKDREGKVRYHYSRPQPKDRDYGPVITDISPEQAKYLLRIGYIERIDDDDPRASTSPTVPTPNTATPAPQPNNAPPEELDQRLTSESLRNGIDAARLHACIAAIAALGLPANAGAPKAREALRVAGQSWPNDVICAAVRARKALANPTV